MHSRSKKVRDRRAPHPSTRGRYRPFGLRLGSPCRSSAEDTNPSSPRMRPGDVCDPRFLLRTACRIFLLLEVLCKQPPSAVRPAGASPRHRQPGSRRPYPGKAPQSPPTLLLRRQQLLTTVVPEMPEVGSPLKYAPRCSQARRAVAAAAPPTGPSPPAKTARSPSQQRPGQAAAGDNRAETPMSSRDVFPWRRRSSPENWRRPARKAAQGATSRPRPPKISRPAGPMGAPVRPGEVQGAEEGRQPFGGRLDQRRQPKRQTASAP